MTPNNSDDNSGIVGIPDEPVKVPRLPGQDFGPTGPSFAVPAKAHIGHKSDSDSYARSKKKTYRNKIAAQKKRTA